MRQIPAYLICQVCSS